MIVIGNWARDAVVVGVDLFRPTAVLAGIHTDEAQAFSDLVERVEGGDAARSDRSAAFLVYRGKAEIGAGVASAFARDHFARYVMLDSLLRVLPDSSTHYEALHSTDYEQWLFHDASTQQVGAIRVSLGCVEFVPHVLADPNRDGIIVATWDREFLPLVAHLRRFAQGGEPVRDHTVAEDVFGDVFVDTSEATDKALFGYETLKTKPGSPGPPIVLSRGSAWFFANAMSSVIRGRDVPWAEFCALRHREDVALNVMVRKES